MAKRIKYPVGIQTFSEIISEGYLYVDKTELIYLIGANFLTKTRTLDGWIIKSLH